MEMYTQQHAWHFVGETLRDGRPIPPDGKWLVHEGTVALCASGLHASRRPWHAMQFAPGNTLCLVEVADIVQEIDDKLVACKRRIIARRDVTNELRAFSRSEALRLASLWACPDVVRQYLETGDESLRMPARAAIGTAAKWTGAMKQSEWEAKQAALKAINISPGRELAAARWTAVGDSRTAGNRFDAMIVALFGEFVKP